MEHAPMALIDTLRANRRLKLALIVAAALLVLGGGFLWALPEIVRRVALEQIPKRIGRAVAIEDIDLNVFTGRLALKKFRLAESGGGQAFVDLERLDVRVAPLALFRSNFRLSEVTLVAPTVQVVRTGPARFNFSDLLELVADRPPSTGPSRWTVTVDRLTIARGGLRARDEAVSPPAEWAIKDFGVDVTSITTRTDDGPGQIALKARIDEAMLDVRVEPLRLDPLKAVVRVALDGFELRRTVPYAFAAAAYQPQRGRLSLSLVITVDHEGEELTKAAVTGRVSVEGQTLVRTGHDQPFFGTSRAVVELKEADLLGRTLTVASLVLDGIELKARRDRSGVIDLVDTFTPRPAPGGSPASAAAPGAAPAPGPPQRRLFPVLIALARGFDQILVERISVEPSTLTFVDEAVTPTATLALSGFRATVTDLTWPSKGPATLAIAAGLPGGGTVDVKGAVRPQPLDANLAVAVRDAPVNLYQPYIPIRARLGGRYNGDSRYHIRLKDGAMQIVSTGNSWADDVEIGSPGRPVIRIERMELVGIDFDWPRRAAVARVGFRRPRVEVVREADGSIELRGLFTPPETTEVKPAGDKPAAPAAPAPGTPAPKGLLETMRLDFKQVRVEQGSVRFLDRTTAPAFSSDLSRLQVTIDGLSNRPGSRARMALQSVVAGDSTLDIRGELGVLAPPTSVDLVGELRRFKLATIDPYAEAATGWIVKKGELEYKMRFKLDGNEIAATNEVVVGHLQVAPASHADEVKQRIGLPLGLIVALVKDGKGEIRVNVPVTGSLDDPKFELGEAIWTAVKNVLVNLVKAPFRAIGRLFSAEDKLEEPKVDAVTFAAGSSVLSPDMEQHLLRVADFLRRTPYVNLTLATRPGSGDSDALKTEAVNARLRTFQKERRLKDGPEVIAAYFKANLPDVKPPDTAEGRLTLLRQFEPVPEVGLDDLARRRLETTRDRLVKVEGIPASRLGAEADASPSAATPEGAGRVEFAVIAGGE